MKEIHKKGGNTAMAPLGLLNIGEQAEIAEIKEQKSCTHGSGKKHLCHAEDMASA